MVVELGTTCESFSITDDSRCPRQYLVTSPCLSRAFACYHHGQVLSRSILMPMPKIGSSSFFRFAVVCIALAVSACSSFVRAQTAPNPASFETLAANAVSARDAGQTEEAIRNYRAALALRPSWDEGWWYLGTLLYDTDHFDEAIPALRRVVELHPQAGPAWAFLGLSEFEIGDYPQAYKDLRTARDLGFAESPDVEKVALYHLALLFNLNGEFERATDLLVSSFGPSHFTDQIKVALGLALLRAPILPSQADPAKDALIHAAGDTAILLSNHDTDAVSRNFEQLLRDYSETPYLHYQYGLLLSTTHRYSDAELHFREETRISPKSPLPWIALARMSEQRNDPEQAVTAARKATQLAPRNSQAYEVLAKALQAQKKNDEAAKAKQRAQELAKTTPEVESGQVVRYMLNRGASGHGGNGSAAAATVDFDEAARLADAERRAGRLDQAAAAYGNALSARSNWLEGWRQLGTIAYMQRRYTDAVSALQQAVALDSKLPDTWTLLGLSEFETRDYKNSLIHLERGRALGFSGNAAAVRISRYHLALLRNLNGDFDRALDLLIPEIAPGALSEEIQFAMGIALLRIPALPEQIKPEQNALVRQAGEVAVLFSDSHYDKAFPIMDRLLREYPNTPFLHYAYGDALAATSMYDEAQIQLREETRLNPRSVLPYLRLASIALLQRHSAAALEDSKKAVAMTPDSAEAHYLLGRSLLEEGGVADAIRELEIARQYAPDSPKVHFNLARAYSKANRAAFAEKERAEFERLNALMPGQKKSYGDRAGREPADEMAARPDPK
jgi:tetratricopeptide (TPR) repeat protein